MRRGIWMSTRTDYCCVGSREEVLGFAKKKVSTKVGVKIIGAVSTVRRMRIRSILVVNINGCLVIGCVIDGGLSINVFNEEMFGSLRITNRQI